MTKTFDWDKATVVVRVPEVLPVIEEFLASVSSILARTPEEAPA